jgi:hypothetical protein
MRQEDVSLRTISRRLNYPLDLIRAQADPCFDLRLSDLYRWQTALKVPIADLIEPPGTGLSSPIRLRANLLKMMKTVRSIQETSHEESVARLAARLGDELVQLMPELREVASWPTVGQRRTLDELGAIADKVVPEAVFSNPQGNPGAASNPLLE